MGVTVLISVTPINTIGYLIRSAARTSFSSARMARRAIKQKMAATSGRHAVKGRDVADCCPC